MPSSRRQTRATAGAFRSVRAKRGWTARRPLDEQPHRRVAGSGRGQSAAPAAGRSSGGAGSDGTRQRTSPAMPSASRLVASTRTPGQPAAARRPGGRRRRAGARSCRAPAAGGAAASAAEQRGQERPAGLLAHAQRARRRPAAPGRVGQRRQLDQPDAVRVVVAQVGRDLERQAGLAHAAGAGQRQQAGRAQQRRRTSASSRSRPTKLVRATGRAGAGRATGGARPPHGRRERRPLAGRQAQRRRQQRPPSRAAGRGGRRAPGR